MHSVAAASFFGLSALTLVSASPLAWKQNWTASSVAIAASATSLPAGAPSAPSASSAPPAPASSGAPPYSGAPPASSTYPAPPPSGSVFSFPLSNGFPNIQNPSAQLTAIELQAQGTLPNGPPPPSLQDDDLTSLKLIAFNELSEVAFFTELLANVTNNVPGYQFRHDHEYQTIVNALTAVQAQEELHMLNANGALTHFGQAAIQPCKYAFPVSDFTSAITLAQTFTDVVLGTLQNVQTHAGQNGDIGLIQGVGSVIGQEGEQNGFYRSLLDKIPSALPFLTTSTREFAFSALNQGFVVAGSCPNANTIPLPIFAPLTVVTPPTPATQNLQFSFTVTDGKSMPAGASLVYINQQNTPIVEPMQNVKQTGTTVTFSALFPYDQFEMNGLTIAAVTNSTGPFASAAAVAAATLFGPGLIEIN